MKRIIYSFLMMIAAVAIGYGQQTISGEVLDGASKEPLIGGELLLSRGQLLVLLQTRWENSR